MSEKNGFGYATARIVESLRLLGHTVTDSDSDAEVFLTFDQPHHIKEWPEDKYNICYFPFESTKLMPEWYDIVNGADEIWTPSPLMKSWMENDSITPPIYVFEHGVDHIWTPKPRIVEDKIRFLNLGFESARKYGPQTSQLFKTAFVGRDDVELTMKMNMSGWGLEKVGRINIINRKYSLGQLIDLYHSHHAFLYLSAGEGFGLPTLQSIATGMPTVINSQWAPYERFIDPKLRVKSVKKDSPWQDIHPGKILRPDFDEAVDRLRFLVDNYESCHSFAQDQTTLISEEYDWLTLTKNMFDSLKKRL